MARKLANAEATTEPTETAENVEVTPLPSEDIKNPKNPEKAEKAAALAALRASLNEAKTVLFGFMETDIYNGLDEPVRNAITRLAKKASPTSAKASTQGELQSLFPEVGTVLDEFDLFKATKMGRAEMRKKVFYAIKKCVDPAEKMWIRFQEVDGDGSWVLDAVGADVPSNWTEKDLPKTRTQPTA